MSDSGARNDTEQRTGPIDPMGRECWIVGRAIDHHVIDRQVNDH